MKDPMPGLLYVPLDDRGILTVTGNDALSFLQDIVSNGVEKVSETSAVYAALLTPQGKFLHDFIMTRLGTDYLLDCEGPRLMDLGRRLAAYKLRAQVELADASDDWRIVALIGDGAAQALELKSMLGQAKALGGGLVYCDPRIEGLGARAILPRNADLGVLTERGFGPGGIKDYENLRISLGVPDGSRDMTVEKTTLMEANFEALHGVDFEKGCYVGQELTARTKHRGLVRRRLVPVALDGPLPPPGTSVMAGDKEAGEVRSGRGDRAIALLRLDRLEQAAAQGVPLKAGETGITPL